MNNFHQLDVSTIRFKVYTPINHKPQSFNIDNYLTNSTYIHYLIAHFLIKTRLFIHKGNRKL